MKASYTQNNFLAYLLVLASLFVLVFFTKNIFSDLQVVMDERDQQNSVKIEKEETLSKLTELKNILKQEDSEALQEIKGFTGDFSEKDILEYIHLYAGQVNSGNERIIMKNILIAGDQVSDLGFNKATIDVSAVFSSESTLFGFLTHLTGPEGKYRFYITRFNYPMNEKSGNIDAQIPLTLYYK